MNVHEGVVGCDSGTTNNSDDPVRCSTCFEAGIQVEMPKCTFCINAYHSKCANVPSAPLSSDFFCRWTCFANYHPKKDAPPSSSSSTKTTTSTRFVQVENKQFAARVQKALNNILRKKLQEDHPHVKTSKRGGQPDVMTRGGGQQESIKSVPDQKLKQNMSAYPPNGHMARGEEAYGYSQRHGGPPPPGYERGGYGHGGAPPSPRIPQDQALYIDDKSKKRPRDHEEWPRMAPTGPGPIDLEQFAKMQTRRSGMPVGPGVAPPNPADVGRLYGPSHGNQGGFVPIGMPNGAQPPPPSGGIPLAPFNPQLPEGIKRAKSNASIPLLPKLAPVMRSSSTEGSPAGGHLYAQIGGPHGHSGHPPNMKMTQQPRMNRDNYRVNAFDGPPPGSSRKPPPAMHPATPSDGNVTKSLKNLPWMNAASFPTSLFERFPCSTDDLNGVFRVDLTSVFGDKTLCLYQNEIDFFYRCLESVRVSLIIKGMASDLNQYIWAWPFILESCGSSGSFFFDHFQYVRVKGEQVANLQYIGKLRMTMTQYHHYLEKFLSTSACRDPIILRDELSKKRMTIIPQEHVITINELTIADCNTQLYHDLVKSFQWDIFPGGIHCLLQYVPPSCRPKRFLSPVFHLNFPGARSSLCDPGNGTTDTVYQVLVGSLELVVFERLEPRDCAMFKRILKRTGYNPERRGVLTDAHLRSLRSSGFRWSTMLINDGEFVHINKGRMHFWRVVESQENRRSIIPCVFLTWEWAYQGVSQRGISHECWFAAKSAALCHGDWAFDPRRAIIEAAKRGLSIVRTGEFLSSTHALGELKHPFSFCSPKVPFTKEAIMERQDQMILFLESILPCMDTIVEDEFEAGLGEDDSREFPNIPPDDVLWTQVDSVLVDGKVNDSTEYSCGICGLELSNCYKQCFGCALYARECKPNQKYTIFRICARCHAQPVRHNFRPRCLDGYFGPLASSEGHTGVLPSTRRYQAVRSYFKCECQPRKQCRFCGGCETCACICHALFQTRFRFESPEYIDRLRVEITDIINWRKHQAASSNGR